MNETRIFGDLKPTTVAEFARVVGDYDLTSTEKVAAGWHLLNTPQPSARAALRVAEGVYSVARREEQGLALEIHYATLTNSVQDREQRAWDRLWQRAYHKANRLSGSHDARGVWSYEVRAR